MSAEELEGERETAGVCRGGADGGHLDSSGHSQVEEECQEQSPTELTPCEAVETDSNGLQSNTQNSPPPPHPPSPPPPHPPSPPHLSPPPSPPSVGTGSLSRDLVHSLDDDDGNFLQTSDFREREWDGGREEGESCGGDGEMEEFPARSGRLSPFFIISKDSLKSVSKLESPGLLYAKGVQEKHNRDLMKPAEVAEDVLAGSEEIPLSSPVHMKTAIGERYGRTGLEEEEGERVGETSRRVSFGSVTNEQLPLKEDGQASVSVASTKSVTPHQRLVVPIDPGALLHLESHAHDIASELGHLMDTLRNSLHAMSVCAVQSVDLQKESLENLQQTVDSNVKAMYTFMAKFEELSKNLEPLHSTAAQIGVFSLMLALRREISETLKLLERSFRES